MSRNKLSLQEFIQMIGVNLLT